jgi:hypothetical protein
VTLLAPPAVALATNADVADLRAFTCADPGVWFEEQVDDFVQRRFLSGPPRSELRSYEPFTIRSAGSLVAVAAIRAWAEAPAAGGTHLVVGAIAHRFRGSRIEGGEPLAAFLMRALIKAARDADHGPFVMGVVAKANTRSIAMCEKSGLRLHLPHDDDHIKVVGTLGSGS